MSLTEVGIRLVVDNSASFTRQVNDSNRSVQDLTGALQKNANQINNSSIGAMLAFANVAGQYVVRAVDQVVNSLKQLTIGSLDIASRFNELMLVARLMAQQQGLTGDEVDKMVTSIRKYGITADVAASLVTQFVRQELDLAKASDLARVAQDAAVVSGQNSSETLQRILWGIQTYNTETLRTAGIQIRADQAMTEYAKTIKKTADSLTPAEKSQAMMNAVLQEGTKIAGAYLKALEDPGKLWRSYERVINDLQIALGTPFLSASREAAYFMTDLTKTFTTAFEEGGKLHWVLSGLGLALEAAGQMANDFLKGMLGVGQAESPVINFLDNLARRFSDAATNAFSWGLNIAAQLANGIIEGATWAITTAMDVVSSMLSWFLSPGSPPRVAPDLPAWGAAAMTQFLKGFEDADFNILNSMEGIFKSAFSTIGSKDQDAWKSFSEGLTKVLAGSGNAAQLMNSIRNTFGAYGNEIARLVGLQIDLAKSSDKLTAAQEALNKAQQKESTATNDMIKAMNQYNALAKAGADPATLAAKRAEFELAKKNREAAITEAQTAAETVNTEKLNNDELNKKINLQSKLVQQILELGKVTEMPAVGAKGGGGGAPALPKVGGAGGLSLLQQTKEEMSKAMEKLKHDIDLGQMREKITGLLSPLQKVGETFSASATKISTSWGRLARVLTPIIKIIETLINKGKDSSFLTWLGRILGVFLTFSVVSGIFLRLGGVVVGVLASLMNPINLAITAIALLFTAYQENWFGIKDVVDTVVPVVVGWINDTLLPILQGVWEWIQTNLLPIFQTVWTTLQNAASTAIPIVSDFITGTLVPAITSLWDWFSSKIIPIIGNVIEVVLKVAQVVFPILWDIIKNVIIPVLNALWYMFTTYIVPVVLSVIDKVGTLLVSAFQTARNIIVDVVLPALTSIWNFISLSLQPIVAGLASFLTDILGPAFVTVAGGVGQLIDMLISVIDWIGKAITDISTFLEKMSEAAGASNQPLGGRGGYGQLVSPGYWTTNEYGEQVYVPPVYAKAKGGGIQKDKSYLVGEKGPEIITPGTSGYVTPWDAIMNVVKSIRGTNNLSQRIAPAMSGRMMMTSSHVNTEQRNYNLTLQTQMQPTSVVQGFQTLQILGS